MKRTFVFRTLLTAFVAFAITAIASAATIPIKVVAFGGKVTITNTDGKSITPAKGVAVPIGSSISTGPNSWIDLAQGGVSAFRVKAKTSSFKITTSSFDADTKKVTSISFH